MPSSSSPTRIRERQSQGQPDGGGVLRLQLRLLQARSSLIQQLLSEDKEIRYIYKQFPILSETSYYAAARRWR